MNTREAFQLAFKVDSSDDSFDNISVDDIFLSEIKAESCGNYKFRF